MTSPSFILWQVLGTPTQHLRRLVGVFPDLAAAINAAAHQFRLTSDEANHLAIDHQCNVSVLAASRSVYLTIEIQKAVSA